MTIDELTQAIVEIGQSKFRAGQIYSWIHQKNVESFDKMTNLSKDLRKILDDRFELLNCSIEKNLYPSIIIQSNIFLGLMMVNILSLLLWNISMVILYVFQPRLVAR